MVASISTRWPLILTSEKSCGKEWGIWAFGWVIWAERAMDYLKEVWLRSASLLWYIHRIPLDPLVCGFVIMVIYDCPCHQMPDGLKFFFTDLHLQPAMARVWANHGLVLASSCCAEACWPVLYCWESVYPNISPYSIQILITLCSPSCVKSDSYLGPPGQWQLGIFELQNSGKLHLGG